MSTDPLDEARRFRTLEEALNWGFARRPAAVLAGVVTQDEYTHDVILRLAENDYLVLDCT